MPFARLPEVTLALPSNDRLTLLYRVSQAFNSTLDLDTVLERVMDQVIALTHAERGFLMLRNADRNLEFRVARGMDQRTIVSPEFQISRGLVERVANEGQPTLTSDAQSDAWLGARMSVTNLGLRSILCVPLKLKEATIGVIYVDNRLRAGIFQPDDLDLLSAIASSAATAIENARLYQVAVEKGRLERELQMGFEVQSRLIPTEMPRIAGWDIAASWQPARVVSGDFYDFIRVSVFSAEPMPVLDIVIADVSDKGMGAALFMANTRAVVRASASGSAPLAQSITQANRLISADAADGMFVTLCIVRLDASSGDLTYVNAGHNPPLLYRVGTAQLIELERTGMALGIDEGSSYQQRTAQLTTGDLLVLYTDGVTDASDAQEHEFGEERLRMIIQENNRASAAELVQALEHALQDFVGNVPPFDDITLVVAKRV